MLSSVNNWPVLPSYLYVIGTFCSFVCYLAVIMGLFKNSGYPVENNIKTFEHYWKE